MASEIIVLLGAGASVDAGLPTMAKLVSACAEAIESDSTIRGTAGAILERLRSAYGATGAGKQVDLELLLEALDALEDKSQNVLSAFVHATGWQEPASGEVGDVLAAIRRTIHDVLRRRLDVEPQRVDYYTALVEVAVELGGMDVYTLNYDAAIEIACESANIAYTDGFDSYWNPGLLQRADIFPVRLHKLHGSLLWYKGRSGRMLKLPLRPGTFPSESAHISGSPLSEAMIYPGPGKALHSTPFADLLAGFREATRRAKLIIVVGCSLRDVHVRQAVVEALRDNPKLLLQVCDPNPSMVLFESDRLSGDPGLRFAQFAARISLYHGGAKEYFESRAPLRSWAYTRRREETFGAYVQALRLGQDGKATEQVRTFLGDAANAGAWPLVIQACLEVRSEYCAALQLLLRPDRSVSQLAFCVAILAKRHSDTAVREKAAAVLEHAVSIGCQWGWRKEGLAVIPIVPSLGKDEGGGFGTAQIIASIPGILATNRKYSAWLQMLLKYSDLALTKEQVADIRELESSLEAVSGYLAELPRLSRPKIVKVKFGNRVAEVPVPPDDSHLALAEVFERGPPVPLVK